MLGRLENRSAQQCGAGAIDSWSQWRNHSHRWSALRPGARRAALNAYAHRQPLRFATQSLGDIWRRWITTYTHRLAPRRPCVCARLEAAAGNLTLTTEDTRVHAGNKLHPL